jgi:hypothetical protein
VGRRVAWFRVLVPAALIALIAGCATTSKPGAPGAPEAPSNPPAPAGAPPGTTAPAPGGQVPIPTPLAPLPGTPAAPPEAPSLGFFSSIRVPDGQDPVLQLSSRGAQVFRCEAREGGGYVWTFKQPDAELDDAKGQAVGRHGPNFSFEVADGSHLIGHVVGHDSAPKDGALPWLLLQTESYGDGTLKGVDYVQRINTSGGMPPPRCQPGQDQQVLRVDFTADFVFYRPH